MSGALLAVFCTLGAAPSPPPDAAALASARRLGAQGRQASKAGDIPLASAALERAAAACRATLGDAHPTTIQAVQALADHLMDACEWVRAAEGYAAVAHAETRLRGAGHWRAEEARRDERLARAAAAWPAARVARWRGMVQACRLAERALGASRTADALALLRPALAASADLRGAGHPGTLDLHRLAGSLTQVLGDSPSALAMAEHALRSARAAWGEGHPCVAAAVIGVGLTLYNAGDAKAASERYLEALRMLRGLGEWRHQAYHTALHNLAVARQEMGDLAGAQGPAREALRLRVEIHGERHEVTAYTLHSLSGIEAALGRRDEALRLARRTADIFKEAKGENHPIHAQALNAVAEILRERGDVREALPLYQKCRDVARAAYGEKSILYTTALNNLGMAYRSLGDMREARRMHEEALRIRATSPGKRHPLYVVSLSNLTLTLVEAGRYADAEARARETMAAARAVHGERHRVFQNAVTMLAEVHRQRGDPRTAVEMLRKCVEASTRLFGPRDDMTTSALNNLALAYEDLGDMRQAAEMLERVLRLRRETLPVGHPLLVASIGTLGQTRARAGDPAGAEALLREALEATRRTEGADGLPYCAMLNSLGNVLRDSGRARPAAAIFREGERLALRLGGEAHPLTSTMRHGLGLSLDDLGETAQAREVLGRVLATRRVSLGRRHQHAIATAVSLAVLEARAARPGAALVYAEEALTAMRASLSLAAAVLSERQQLAATAELRVPLDLRLSLPEESAESSHGHALAWKGAVFERQRQAKLFARLEDNPEARDAARSLLAVTRRLAALAGEGRPDAERAGALLREKEGLEGRLSALSAEFRAGRAGPSSLALRESLPEGAVLVDYLGYKGQDPARRWREGGIGPRMTAWVVRRGRPVARVDLGPAADIERAARRWRSEIEAGRPAAAEAAAVRRLAWEPLARHVEGAGTALISADGTLSRVPFAALPGSRQGSVLLEEVAVVSVPVPRLLASPPALSSAGQSLLAVGGVSFGDAGPWAALPGSGAEADAVSQRFRAVFGGKPTSLAGAAATREAVRDGLPRHRTAHLATHGFFTAGAGVHPGLLSGLVLSGGGLLTALEVAEMDLAAVDLAVLSACQTGLGKEAAAEGLLGLQRAFQVAGCRSVVSSLWSVDDAATAVLMERFYLHLWQKKLSKAEALRLAQLEVMRNPEWVEGRAKALAAVGTRLRGAGKAAEVVVSGKKERRSPPAWWAAWQLSGDWR